MISNLILPLLSLSALYTAVVAGLVWLLRRAGVPAKRAVILGCLVFAVVTGLLTAWVWPLDSSVYFNVFASLLGEAVYDLSIRHLGDASSTQAHYTVPWAVRVPQVYVVSSVLLSGLVGLPFQWAYGRRVGRMDLPDGGS